MHNDDTSVPLQLDPAVTDQMEQGPPLIVSVQVQSCNDKRICLAPSDLIETVNRWPPGLTRR